MRGTGEHRAIERGSKSFIRQCIIVVVCVVAASVVNVGLPGRLMIELFGRVGLFDVAAGVLLSVPMYVCGGLCCHSWKR